MIDPAPYEQLALAFTLSEQGITLHGRCPVSGPPGAILVDRTARMLGEPGVKNSPTIALVADAGPARRPAGARQPLVRTDLALAADPRGGGRWTLGGGQRTLAADYSRVSSWSAAKDLRRLVRQPRFFAVSE